MDPRTLAPLLAALLLSACATPGADRPGGSAPSAVGEHPGPQPSTEEIVATLEAMGKKNVRVRSVSLTTFQGRTAFGPLTTIRGWLACYSHTSTHVLTRQPRDIHDGVMFRPINGRRTPTTGPGPEQWCKEYPHVAPS